jgi:carbamoyltransferase
VDGSARVQTVTTPGLLSSVLCELKAATDLPVVLNTSLNGPGEPIVAHATDALGFLCSHPIDALVIEDMAFWRPS